MLLPLANALLDTGTSCGGIDSSFDATAFETTSEATGSGSSFTNGAATFSVVSSTSPIGVFTGSIDKQNKNENVEF